MLLSFLSPTSSSIGIISGLALLGIGGVFQTPNNNMLMTAVPRRRVGVGSAFLSIVRSVGYSSGATLAASIVGHYLLQASGDSAMHMLGGSSAAAGTDSLIRAAFLHGFRSAYLTVAVVAFIGALLSLWPVSGRNTP